MNFDCWHGYCFFLSSQFSIKMRLSRLAFLTLEYWSIDCKQHISWFYMAWWNILVLFNTLTTNLVRINWKFPQNHTGYFKNYWTDTRLVSTHLKAFSMLNPNMPMKIWITENAFKKFRIFLSSALDVRMERDKLLCGTFCIQMSGE